MNKILITGHGHLPDSFNESINMLMGYQTNVTTINFLDNMGVNELKSQISNYFDKNKNILVFCDLLGGTPFNVTSLIAKDRDDVEIVYGMNLPVILEAITNNEMNVKDMKQHLSKIMTESIAFSDLNLS
ncbi:PTS sugar transporter subunit IIA [Aerococcus urinae]|uniref:PTS sugar transporter subunit IIA n=1 Tax=Aerococcus urinae TaxID=1376 RepID=UPI002551880A|nr:PTS sugar transporter subunit IIA [Aerococcus urinae]MDK6371106.1 PTS sugar transporter subunit IIA [Aerococcus urinae]